MSSDVAGRVRQLIRVLADDQVLAADAARRGDEAARVKAHTLNRVLRALGDALSQPDAGELHTDHTYQYVAVYDVQDPTRPRGALIAEACRDIDADAARAGGRILGDIVWHRDGDRLVAVAPARPIAGTDRQPQPLTAGLLPAAA